MPSRSSLRRYFSAVPREIRKPAMICSIGTRYTPEQLDAAARRGLAQNWMPESASAMR